MSKKKQRIPTYWVIVAGVVLATNNFVQFIINIKTGDMLVYLCLAGAGFLTLRNFKVIKEFK
jgi:hypothetical protein